MRGYHRVIIYVLLVGIRIITAITFPATNQKHRRLAGGGENGGKQWHCKPLIYQYILLVFIDLRSPAVIPWATII